MFLAANYYSVGLVSFKWMTNVSNMSEERAITVLTCRGDVSDPSFPRRLQKLVCKLHRLVNRGKCDV